MKVFIATWTRKDVEADVFKSIYDNRLVLEGRKRKNCILASCRELNVIENNDDDLSSKLVSQYLNNQ